MKKTILHFDGVRVAKDYMTGVILSAELVDKFNQDWIPFYQRDRIMRKSKINELKSVFINNGKIDSIKLNLCGEYHKDGRQAVLEGSFRVIDGQQRLWALKESGVKNIQIPIELYINIPEDEEVMLFHQFNREQSKLCPGDMIKSTQGSLADLIRRIVKDKNYPIRVTWTSRATGLVAVQYASILHMAHRKIFLNTLVAKPNVGKKLLNFLEDHLPQNQVFLSEYAARNILKSTLSIFGNYDHKALCYSRSFFLPWCLVVTTYFLNESGNVNFKNNQTKIETLPKLLNNARMRELLGGGNFAMVFDMIVGHFNHKKQRNRLSVESMVGQSEKMISYRHKKSEMTKKQMAADLSEDEESVI